MHIFAMRLSVEFKKNKQNTIYYTNKGNAKLALHRYMCSSTNCMVAITIRTTILVCDPSVISCAQGKAGNTDDTHLPWGGSMYGEASLPSNNLLP